MSFGKCGLFYSCVVLTLLPEVLFLFKMKSGTFFVLFFTVIIIVVNALMIIEHEQAHQAIFRSYGIESEIDYFVFEGGFLDWAATTTGDDPDGKCNETCQTMHNYNEIVSYNLQGIYTLLSVGLLVIIILLAGITNTLREDI